MKKRLSIIAVLALVGLLTLCWHFYGGTAVPAGQPPLVSLTSTNFDQLRAAFNSASGEVRIVLLLSPT
jgi:outer membrane lipopolysaccharide assembly protein LptE/RlpB